MQNSIILLTLDNTLFNMLDKSFDSIDVSNNFFELINKLTNKPYKIAIIDAHEIPQFNENSSIKILNSISPIMDIIIISKYKTYQLDYLRALYDNNKILSVLNTTNDMDYLYSLINYSIEKGAL